MIYRIHGAIADAKDPFWIEWCETHREGMEFTAVNDEAAVKFAAALQTSDDAIAVALAHEKSGAVQDEAVFKKLISDTHPDYVKHLYRLDKSGNPHPVNAA